MLVNSVAFFMHCNQSACLGLECIGDSKDVGVKT